MDTPLHPVESFLSSVCEVMKGDPPTCYKFILDSGERMAWKSHELTGTKEIGMCYRNALNMAIDHGLIYVEGYALPLGLMSVEHAWCLDPSDGKVIDPTWGISADYYGVKFDTRAICAQVVEQGYYGVLPSLWRLRRPRPELLPWLQTLRWQPPALTKEKKHDAELQGVGLC